MKRLLRRRPRKRPAHHPSDEVVVRKLEDNRDRQTEKASPGPWKC